MKKIFLASLFALIACSSNGAPGINGQDGQNGKDGLPGEKGEQGIPGTAAAKGDPGKNGDDNRIARTWRCDSKRDIALVHVDGPTVQYGVEFWYYVQETSIGDTFVRAGVDVHRAASPELRTGKSSTEFWPAGTWEAKNAADWVLQDIDEGNNHSNTGNWSFLLDKAANRVSVTYTDKDYVGTNFSYVWYCN